MRRMQPQASRRKRWPPLRSAREGPSPGAGGLEHAYSQRAAQSPAHREYHRHRRRQRDSKKPAGHICSGCSALPYAAILEENSYRSATRLIAGCPSQDRFDHIDSGDFAGLVARAGYFRASTVAKNWHRAAMKRQCRSRAEQYFPAPGSPGPARWQDWSNLPAVGEWVTETPGPMAGVFAMVVAAVNMGTSVVVTAVAVAVAIAVLSTS